MTGLSAMAPHGSLMQGWGSMHKTENEPVLRCTCVFRNDRAHRKLVV